MQKQIKDIVVGDLVKSWDFDKEKVVPAEVLKLWKHKNDKQCYKLNNKLTITGSHRVYTKDGYKETKDINVGDKLLGSDGKYIKVKSFKLYELDVPYVHNLTVKINNYFADGILVHNMAKAGKWEGNDKKANVQMRMLTDALTAYTDTTALMSESYAEQTGDVGEKLDLQRRELATQMKASSQASSQKKSALETKLGRTGLANVGNEQRRSLEQERQIEGDVSQIKTDTLSMTSEHEKNALLREMDKEKIEMEQSLRSTISQTRGALIGIDRDWDDPVDTLSHSTKNVFRFTEPKDMLKAWENNEPGFLKFCVTPNTKIEIWTPNG